MKRSVESSPKSHSDQACRDRGNAQLPRAHFVFSRALHDDLLLFAEVAHAGVITVDSETNERSRAFSRISVGCG